MNPFDPDVGRNQPGAQSQLKQGTVEMFVLDTDHFSLMEWSEGSARQILLRRLNAVPAEEVFTTIVTYEEQTRG